MDVNSQTEARHLSLGHVPIVNPARELGSNWASISDQPRTRVMHVSLGTQLGGMERLLVEFAKFTDRSRFELSFASLESRGNIANEIEALHWPVYEFNKQSGLRPGVVVRLSQQMRKCHTQVVHTHNTSAFIYGVLAARLAGVSQIIHTRHGQRFGASSRETFLFRRLTSLARRVACVSEDGRRLSEQEGVPTRKLCTILNGIDLRRFHFAGIKPYAPAISVARLSPEKDIASLIRAIPLVLPKLGSNAGTFTLNIVGDGSQRSALERLTHELKLNERVQFLGQKNNVQDLLTNASMFVLPSLTEGISLTLLEAMARGLPVVATRVGGTPEVVVDGHTGLLVSTQRPDELAAAIAHLFQNPATAERMGQLGRQRVEQSFSITRMIRAYEEEYVSEVRR